MSQIFKLVFRFWNSIQNFSRGQPWDPFFLLAVFLFSIFSGDARRCYSCSTDFDSDEYDCLYNVENYTETWNNITVVDCPYFCTIRRQEYADYPGGVNYLNRSCEESKLDEVIVSGYFITYLRSCKRDLCNSGDGISSLKDLPEDEDDELGPEVGIWESSYAESIGSSRLRDCRIPYLTFTALLFYFA